MLQMLAFGHEESCGLIKSNCYLNLGNFRYGDAATLIAESEEELKSLLLQVKEVNEKVGLKHTFRKLRSWHPVPSFHGK